MAKAAFTRPLTYPYMITGPGRTISAKAEAPSGGDIFELGTPGLEIIDPRNRTIRLGVRISGVRDINDA